MKNIALLASGSGSNVENIANYFAKNPEVYISLVITNNPKAINLIVLAGFLLKIPQELVKAYPNKIVNIHPALLPKFGGKGMYGMYVHRAVKEAGETETGISIHYVNEHYDQGTLIFQAKTLVNTQDTPEDIATKVQALEAMHFPRTIETLLDA